MVQTADYLLYRIALTLIDGVGGVTARNLMEVLGDEKEIFGAKKKDLLQVRGISESLASAILDANVLKRAEKEVEFVLKNNLCVYFYRDDNYPFRLKECADAPLLLYYKGKADLNAPKVVSIIGTRKPTDYGLDFCSSFLESLASISTNILVVSGLAYGIDIQSHCESMRFEFPTLGVLAHGLDRIYPSVHRKVAAEMLTDGGLLTEFCSNTEPDRFNFVRRNRIVAGLADATLVIESAEKGGSLITANLANGYGREVFALPGRVTDSESKGCNSLIEQNKAVLLNSAEGFMKQMGWDVLLEDRPVRHTQKKLFLDLSDDELSIFNLLKSSGSLHLNLIANQTGISLSSLLPLLFSMELKGMVRPLAGNIYKLL